MEKQSQRITRTQAGLVVVDIQERLLPAMHEWNRVVQNAVRLIRGACVLGLPILVTEQYRKGLGGTVTEVAQAVDKFHPMEKLAFSACGAVGAMERIKTSGMKDVLVCGIEAHVCVTQTCLDLLQEGMRVFIVEDATSSRTLENWSCGIRRMRDAGATIVSVEMALFELLGQAGTDEFKQILNLVK